MDLLRHWAYTLCLAAILLAVLQGILPVKNLSAVIKMVLSLYILLMLLAPITDKTSFRRAQVPDFSSNIVLPEVDVTNAVQSETEHRLEQTVLAGLKEVGFGIEEVVVQSTISEENEFIITKVVLYFAGSPPAAGEIEKSLQTSLGCLPSYEVLQIDGTANSAEDG